MKSKPAPKSKAKSLKKPAAKSAVKPAPKAAAKAVATKGAAKGAAKPAIKPAKSAKAATPVKVAGASKAGPKVAPKLAAKVHAKPQAKAVAPAPKLAAKPDGKGQKPPKVEKPPKVQTQAQIDKKTKAMVAEFSEATGKLSKSPTTSIEEPDTAEDVVLTDAEGRRYCRVKDCDRLAEVDSYCRFHYILLWKNIQTRRHILQEGKLGRYIEELTARYPDKFLEILKKDLRSEKDFMAAIQELEIDESAVEAEFDDEESQSDLFEVQRMSDAGGGGRSDSDEDRF